MIIEKTNLFDKILFICLIFSVLLGQSLYFKIHVLQGIRLFVPLTILFYLFFKNKVIISKSMCFYLLFFLFYLSYTFFVSIFNFTYGLPINDFINHVIILLMVLDFAILFSTIDKIELSNIIIKIIYSFLFICCLVALWEFITKNHLPVSRYYKNKEVFGLLGIPTTFFTNENDYMAAYLQLMLLAWGIKKEIISMRFTILDLLLLVLFLVQSIFVDSRLTILALIIYFIFLFLKNKVVLIFSILVTGCFVILFYGDNITEKIIMEFSNHGSNEIRKNLYILALQNAMTWHGFFGYGLNGSMNFYKGLNTDLFIGDIINPHNYLFELMINSGFIVAVLFLALDIYLTIKLNNKKYYRLSLSAGLFFLILCSSSSSLYYWGQYFIFQFLFFLACEENEVICTY